MRHLIRPRAPRVSWSLFGCGPYLHWLVALGLIISACGDTDEGPADDPDLVNGGDDSRKPPDSTGSDEQNEPGAGTMDSPAPQAGMMMGDEPEAGADGSDPASMDDPSVNPDEPGTDGGDDGPMTAPDPTEATQLRVILVGADDDSDKAIRALLELRKHEVEVVAPSTDAGTMLDSHDVILISASIEPSELHESWRQAALPVVIWEAFSYRDLGLIAGEPTVIGGADDAAGPYLELLDPMHPLSAGLDGTIKLSSLGFNLAAEPGETAVRLGNIRGSSTGAALGVGFFAYESGASLPGGMAAPARRVALPLGVNLATALTADGKSLVEAAVLWAAGDTYTRLARVLPLGDSITRGFNTDSYRAPLAAALDEHGCQYDFVGTLDRVRNNAAHAATFDWDHEGHGGYTTEMILVELSTFLEGQDPDIVLIQLGTNDLLQDVEGSVSEENLGDIIEALRAENPEVAVLLAQIIPGTDPRLAEVAAFNEIVQRVAEAKNQASSTVEVVDLFTGFDTTTLLNADGIHPTAEGDILLAQHWYDLLAPHLPCTSR